MCLILFGWKVHDRNKLVLGANRDEFFKRPSARAEYWEDYPRILAGRDLKAGGTWIGITKKGKWAAITNYRDPENIKKDAPTRGDLTADYLRGDMDPEEYLQRLSSTAGLYNGFNLLLGDNNNLFYYSNIEGRIKNLEPGVYGLSNDLLDSEWPKVVRGKDDFRKLLGSGLFDLESLFDLLDQREIAPDSELPSTGVTLELERALSPLHIDTDNYGTVNSTIILIGTDNQAIFSERTFNKPYGKAQEKLFQFSLEPEFKD